MEPISLTVASTAIFSLMIDWAKERRDNKKPTFDNFQEWLEINHHKDVIEVLEKNRDLSRSIKAFIVDNHSIVMDKLNSIEEQIEFLLVGNSSFKEIVLANNPHAVLPEQSINILKQMNKDNVTSFLELHHLGGKEYIYMESNKGGSLNITDDRFLNDDLNMLIEKGYLQLSYNGNNQKLFTITRLGGSVN